LDVIKEVQNAILTGSITVTQAVIISQLSKNRQSKFLDLVIAKQDELAGALTGWWHAPCSSEQEPSPFRAERMSVKNKLLRG